MKGSVLDQLNLIRNVDLGKKMVDHCSFPNLVRSKNNRILFVGSFILVFRPWRCAVF